MTVIGQIEAVKAHIGIAHQQREQENEDGRYCILPTR